MHQMGDFRVCELGQMGLPTFPPPPLSPLSPQTQTLSYQQNVIHHSGWLVCYLGFSNNEPQRLPVVLHLFLGEQGLAKHLRAAFLGYVVRACRHTGR